MPVFTVYIGVAGVCMCTVGERVNVVWCVCVCVMDIDMPYLADTSCICDLLKPKHPWIDPTAKPNLI